MGRRPSIDGGMIPLSMGRRPSIGFDCLTPKMPNSAAARLLSEVANANDCEKEDSDVQSDLMSSDLDSEKDDYQDEVLTANETKNPHGYPCLLGGNPADHDADAPFPRLLGRPTEKAVRATAQPLAPADEVKELAEEARAAFLSRQDHIGARLLGNTRLNTLFQPRESSVSRDANYFAETARAAFLSRQQRIADRTSSIPAVAH